MGLRIKTNVEALVAQRRLSDSRQQLGDSLEKLSSGQRINKSADDAAGLAVSERIRSRIRSMEVAKRNASDGISYIQVAEGSLNEVTNIMSRMRELTAQSASDTIGNRERAFLDKEFQQLRQEVARIIDTTEFNGTRVLKTEEQRPIEIFVGTSNRGDNLNGEAPQIDKESDPDILRIDLADLISLETALGKVTDSSLSIIPPDGGGAPDLGPEGTGDLLNRMDTALNAVAAYRSTLGSVQSRINSTVTNIDISIENLNAAQSRIRDVDYASETAKFTQAKILTQAGLSVAMQANATPEYVLALLRGSG